MPMAQAQYGGALPYAGMQPGMQPSMPGASLPQFSSPQTNGNDRRNGGGGTSERGGRGRDKRDSGGGYGGGGGGGGLEGGSAVASLGPKKPLMCRGREVRTIEEAAELECILELAHDQNGCRFLQDQLDLRTKAHVDLVFEATLEAVVALSMDPFGNYLIQKLLQYGVSAQRTRLVLTLTLTQPQP